MPDCENEHIARAREALFKIRPNGETTKGEIFEHASEALRAMREFNGGAREAFKVALRSLDHPSGADIPTAMTALRELKAITGDARTPDKPFAPDRGPAAPDKEPEPKEPEWIRRGERLLNAIEEDGSTEAHDAYNAVNAIIDELGGCVVGPVREEARRRALSEHNEAVADALREARMHLLPDHDGPVRVDKALDALHELRLLLGGCESGSKPFARPETRAANQP